MCEQYNERNGETVYDTFYAFIFWENNNWPYLYKKVTFYLNHVDLNELVNLETFQVLMDANNQWLVGFAYWNIDFLIHFMLTPCFLLSQKK